jgi:hypothetical protein
MTPGLRKLNLTAHVVSSVGWTGAVVSFLVLSIAGLRSQNTEIVRSSYLSMNLIGQFVIVPLSIAALVTGLVQSLGTHWGLVKHYWVLTKFALTVGATILLLLHQFTAVAEATRRVSATSAEVLPDVGRLGAQLVFDAGFAVLVLVTTTTLSVFKPWGRTRYARNSDAPAAAIGGKTVIADVSCRVKALFALIGLILVTIVVLHLTGHGLGGHGM